MYLQKEIPGTVTYLWPPKVCRALCRACPAQPDSARVASPVTCTYVGLRSLYDLQRTSRLRYVARSRASKPSYSTVSFASITCSQKRTAGICALSRRKMVAIMLPCESTPTLSARPMLDQPECEMLCPRSGYRMVALKRWLLTDQIQALF